MQTLGVLAITALLYSVGAPNDDAARQPLTVKHASAAETAGLDVATQRFAAAGLTLPPLIVAFSDDPADCYGHLGIFDAATTPWTITVCCDLAFVPTHELAHAWLDANMDTAARHQYLTVRRIERWDEKRDEWSDRGVEDAAFVIQQNLMITPPTPLSAEWRRRADAFELLTGHVSPLRKK
jgi:hypothetical protein